MSDRKAAQFAAGVAAYTASADGKKLLYRAGGQGGAGRGGGAPGASPGPSLFLVDADKAPPAAGQGRVTATLRMFLDRKEEFRQIFGEGWRNQRDYLYVPNPHGTDWPKMKQMYGQLLPYVRHRADLNYLLDNMGAEIAIGHSYVRGGDLMPYMFRHLKIGPLVGKRTWGGLVHTADTPPSVDGGSMIAPRGGFFTRDMKWAVENEGVAPDIDVENWPKDVIAGKDPQLERAVDEALRLLKAKPVDRATKEPPPPTWGVRKDQGIDDCQNPEEGKLYR